MMRLVQHHGIGSRQQLSEAVIAQRHVGQKKMVIDHHNLRRQGTTSGSIHETPLDLPQLTRSLSRFEQATARGAAQSVQADIVLSPLEQYRVGVYPERAPDH